MLTRGLSLQAAIGQRDDMDASLADAVEQVMMRALDTVEQIAHLEAELAARTPAEIHEELEVIAECMEADLDTANTEALIERKVALAEELAEQDARQAELARCASRVLETSSELTTLRDRLHAATWSAEDDQTLAVLMAGLEVEVEAREEVQAVVRG